MKEFLNLILNNIEPITFLAYLLYAFVGFILNLLFDILRRKPESKKSPYEWDWSYWWVDNWRRIVWTVTLLPFAIVFSKFISGTDMNIYLAFMTGWGADTITNILKRRGLIKGKSI